MERGVVLPTLTEPFKTDVAHTGLGVRTFGRVLYLFVSSPRSASDSVSTSGSPGTPPQTYYSVDEGRRRAYCRVMGSPPSSLQRWSLPRESLTFPPRSAGSFPCHTPVFRRTGAGPGRGCLPSLVGSGTGGDSVTGSRSF